VTKSLSRLQENIVGQMVEWSITPDCKSGASGYAGSNPALPTNENVSPVGWDFFICRIRRNQILTKFRLGDNIINQMEEFKLEALIAHVY
jgi:hypothetical protein